MAEKITILDLGIKNQSVIDALVKQKDALNGSKKALDDLKKSQDATTEEIELATLALKKNEAEYKSVQKVAESYSKTINEQDKSIEGMRKQLSGVSVQWARLTEEEQKNTAEGQRLTKQKTDLTAELKRLESATGDNRRNVGNYTESIILAGKSLNDLKGELSTLQATIQTLDVNTQEFKDAQNQAGELGLAIGQLEGKLDEFGNKEPKNPAKKSFEDLLATTASVGSAMALLSSTMGDNEDAQKNLQKAVQSVAIAQTVANVVKEKGAIIDTLTLVKTKAMAGANALYTGTIALVTGATRIFGVTAVQAWAVATLGLSLLITGIVALAMNFERVTNAVRSFLGLGESLKQQAKDIKTSFEAKTKAMENDLEVMKASGASARALYLAELELNNNRIRGLVLQRQKTKLSKEEKEQLDDLIQANKVLNASETQRIQEEKAEREASGKEEALKRETAELERQKELRDDAKRQREKEADDVKNREEQAKTKREADAEANKQLVEDARTLAELGIKNAQDELAIQKLKSEMADLTGQQQIDAIQSLAILERRIIEDKLRENLITEKEYEIARLELKKKTKEEIEAIETETDEKNKENRQKRKEEEEQDAKDRVDLQQMVSEASVALSLQVLGEISNAVGKNTKAGKILAIAEATINTYVGATKALTLPPPASYINFALTLSTGLATVAKIIKTPVEVKKFARGGEVEIGGNRHSQGGTKFYGEDGTSFEAERGERLFILNRGANARLNALAQFNDSFRIGSRQPNVFATGGEVIRGIQSRGSQATDIAGALSGLTIVTDVKDVISEVARRNELVDLATI